MHYQNYSHINSIQFNSIQFNSIQFNSIVIKQNHFYAVMD
jgi:hypothetical protein